MIKSSLPAQNGRHFAGDIFTGIFMKENFCILLRISGTFIPKGPGGNKSMLVQVMALCRTCDKPAQFIDRPVHWRIYVALVEDEITT